MTGAPTCCSASSTRARPNRHPVWMSREQFAYWTHTHLTIDVVPGRGAGFSLEGPTGNRFLIRSRVFTDEESAELAAAAL